MHALDFHLEDEISTHNFELPEEHISDHPESSEVEDRFNELYWQEGAFNAITHCSNLFDNCSCH